MLVLSTAHLPETVFKALEKEADRDTFVSRSIPHEYGVIVYANEPRESAPELAAIITHAQLLGCSWINFDRDADTIDGLPTWSW